MMDLKDDEVVFRGYDEDKYTILKYKDIKSPDDFVLVDHKALKCMKYTVIGFSNGNNMSVVVQDEEDYKENGGSSYGRYDIWESIVSPDCAFRCTFKECFEHFRTNYNKAYVEHTCEHCGVTREELEQRS